MTITIRTDLLLAISRWALDDDTRLNLRVVLFKDDEAVACDGHRIVRVPVKCNGLTLAIDRDLIAAAAAVQAHCKSSAPRDDVYDGRALSISADDKRVCINAGRFTLTGPLADHSKYPPYEKVMPTSSAGTPDGYGFQPHYLVGIHEVTAAMGSSQSYVKIEAWSAATSTGYRDPMLFTNDRGARFVIMPVRA